MLPPIGGGGGFLSGVGRGRGRGFFFDTVKREGFRRLIFYFFIFGG